jgi:bacterioferritin-associated ferredoxin
VTQSRIRAAINAGARTVDEVTAACGAGGDCGSCRDEIQSMLEQQHSIRMECFTQRSSKTQASVSG